MVEPGQVLDGKYRIVRLIGEGGMGAVFEGENIRINRRVAIKVLHGAALANAETVQRFEREAQAAGRIGSEHILEILDLGVLPDGERYMVMEFLVGETLSSRIRSHGRLTPQQIVPLARQTLVGLGAAHAAGIVHRDMKPDNLFVLKERSGIRDYVKIIDFGISKFNVLGGDMSMTRTGAVMGTPYYMSPEQAKGTGGVDLRSDLYAVGVILYEAVTGEVPFTANTFNELIFKIALSDPIPLTQRLPDLDQRFADVVSRAMARDPNDRFATANEMIQALDALGYGGFAGSAALEPMPAEPSRSAVAAVTGQRTQGTFASSQQTGIGAAKSSGRLMLAAGAVVLVLAGGAFAAYRALGAKSAEPIASASLTAEPEPAPKAAAEAPTPPAATAAPAPTAAPSVIPGTPASVTAAASAAASASAAVAARDVPKRVPGPLPRPAAGAAKAAGTSKTSSKSSRDFGY
jgi:eukaryotic-like serine/threonine-protein kinase